MPGNTILQGLLQRDDMAAALVWHERGALPTSWSFRELQAARRYAVTVLRAAGMRRGCRILLLCGDRPHVIALLLAALELELCLLPLHPDQDPCSLRAVVAMQAPALAIADAGARRAWPLLRSLVHPCCLLDARAAEWLRWEPALAPDVTADQAREPVADCAAVFHSSGSTGRPKALYYSRSQLDTFLYWQQRLFAPFNDEAAATESTVPTPRINVLPLTHWGGLAFCLQALAEGRAVHLYDEFRAAFLLSLIERTACRLLMLVPAMYRELLPSLEQRCPPSLRYCLTMGEAMPSRLAEALRRAGLVLCNAYGMSEALSGLAHGGLPLELVPPGSCGQHAFGELQLVSADGIVQSASGAAEGELWVRNATTQPCYRDVGLLQQKYVDGWYRTGDCFRRDAAGHYYFRSRRDAMCVHNGRNVYPQQVEAVFIEHPAVAACIAAPLQLADGRQRLGVGIVPAPGVLPTSHELLDYYLRHGAHYAAPAFLLLLDAVPTTWSGKPERAELAALLQAAYDRESGLRVGIGDTPARHAPC